MWALTSFVAAGANASTTFQIDLTAAGIVQKFKGEGERVDSGLSVRTQASLFWGGGSWKSGPLVRADFRSTFSFDDVILGWGIRKSEQNVYFEAGAGFNRHVLFGSGYALIFGVGWRVTSRLFIVLPIVYRSLYINGQDLQYTPHLGFRF